MRPLLKIIKYSVKTVEEEQQIADNLLQGNIVIADLSSLPQQYFDLVVSFLEGVLFGINSQMIYLREDVLLLLPEDISFEDQTIKDFSAGNFSIFS